jgi:hypothetical protein
MGWRLTGTVLHRYDPAEEGTFAAVYCEELEMQYRGSPLFLSSIHNDVENKLAKLHNRAREDLAELQNPAKIAIFHCTKSTK